MEAKHTPGPWLVKPLLTPENDDDPMGVYKVQPAFDELTKLYFEMDPEEDMDFDEKVHGVNEANARLIAAAPELLGALEQIAFCVGDGSLPLRKADAYAMVEIARAAIAKTRGEA